MLVMTDQPRRRFTPQWDLEDNGRCFIVRDSTGQALLYVYYEWRKADESSGNFAGAVTHTCRRAFAIASAAVVALAFCRLAAKGRLC
jgi:hypothetical protein